MSKRDIQPKYQPPPKKKDESGPPKVSGVPLGRSQATPIPGRSTDQSGGRDTGLPPEQGGGRRGRQLGIAVDQSRGVPVQSGMPDLSKVIPQIRTRQKESGSASGDVQLLLDTFLSPALFAEVEPELAQEQQALRDFAAHLFDSAKEIDFHRVEADASPDQAQSHHRKAAVIACKALEQLVERQHLRNGLKLLAVLRRHPVAAYEVFKSIDVFFEAEKDLLKECGADPALIDDILGNVPKFLAQIRKGERQDTPLTLHVLQTISTVAKETCEYGEQMKRSYQRKQAARRLLRASQCIGGAAVVLANAGSLFLPDTPPGLVELSGAVGIAAITLMPK